MILCECAKCDDSMSNIGSRKHEHFPVLDALRGCAAILVAQRHMSGDFWAGQGFFRTYLAVDLFFLLSGFVIAAAYSNRLETGQLSAQRFMLIRWIRLYPMYFLATALAILAAVPAIGLAATSTGWHVWAALGLTSAATFIFLPSHWLGGISLFVLNGPFWSLFYELIINAAYAVTARVLNNLRLVLVIAVALVVVITLALKIATGLDSGWVWAWPHVFMGVARSMFGIGAGILLYKMRGCIARALNIQKGFHASWGIVIPLLMVALMAAPSLGVLDVPFDILICAGLFPLGIFFATKVNWENRWFLLGCSTLGTISYPIYVLHIPVSSIIKSLAPTWLEAHAAIAGFTVLAFLLVLSYASEKAYEIPVRRWLSRRILNK